MCDGGERKYQCRDKSDEDPTMCTQWNCTDGHRKCEDGLQCIHEGSVCDGVDNCNDKSDEDHAMCLEYLKYFG